MSQHRRSHDAAETVVVVTDAPDQAAYAEILREQRLWLEQVIGVHVGALQPGAEAEYADPFASYHRSGTVAMVARVRGRPAGIVALQPLPADRESVELKRMYVRPAARGTGLGRRLARAALDEARAAGWRHVVLDTHPASMGEALGLYVSLGFTPVSPLGLALADGVRSMAVDLAPDARKALGA